jgi:hypothetical protein
VLGSKHHINTALCLGNGVCFALRSRFRAVATQDRKVARFRRGSDEPDAALAFHADDVPAIGSLMAQHVIQKRENLSNHRLDKGVSDDDPRCGQAQNGSGQAAGQDVKGVGV